METFSVAYSSTLKSLLGHFWLDFDIFFPKSSLLLSSSEVSFCRNIIQKPAAGALINKVAAKSLLAIFFLNPALRIRCISRKNMSLNDGK